MCRACECNMQWVIMMAANVRTETGVRKVWNEYRGSSPTKGVQTLLKQALSEGSVLDAHGDPLPGLLHLLTLTLDVLVSPQKAGSRQSLPLLKDALQTTISGERSIPDCTRCSQSGSAPMAASSGRPRSQSRQRGKRGS